MKSSRRLGVYIGWGFIAATLTIAAVVSPNKKSADQILQPLTPAKYEVGTQVSGQGLGHVFQVRNNADQPLSVSIRKSCSCLAAEVVPNPIPAHADATVSLAMFVPAQASGRQGAVAVLTGDRPGCNPVALEMWGDYLVGLRAVPTPVLIYLHGRDLDQTIQLHKNNELYIDASSLKIVAEPTFLHVTVLSTPGDWPVRVQLTGRLPDDAADVIQGALKVTVPTETDSQQSELVVPIRLTRETGP